MSKKLLDYFPADVKKSIIEEILSDKSCLTIDELKKALSEREGSKSDAEIDSEIQKWADVEKNG